MPYLQPSERSSAAALRAARRLAPVLGFSWALASLAAQDFGDAPAPYPTVGRTVLVAGGGSFRIKGAAHEATGPNHGTLRDTESEGQPTSAADGDDANGLADEDGVVFDPILRVGRLGAGATVTVTNAPSGARLDAWIDWNGDGNWGGPYERVAAGLAVTQGTSRLTFDIPAFAKSGSTFARFRLMTAGGLGPSGTAVDGEVEDYAVVILPPRRVPGTFGSTNTVSDAADGASSLCDADLDRDGDMDVVSASYYDGKIAWYENDGAQSFTEHVISLNAYLATAVFVQDLDGDGDLDVMSSARYDRRIVWFENDGSMAFDEEVISTEDRWDWSKDIVAANLDVDGAVPSADAGTLPGGDGDIDLVTTSVTDKNLEWYRNDGTDGFTKLRVRLTAGFEASVAAVDLDKDGDMDVISAATDSNEIAFYRNRINEAFDRIGITTAATGARSVVVADIDNDGGPDLAAAASGAGAVRWYRITFSLFGTPIIATRTVSENVPGAEDVAAADIDGDGDFDFVSASSFGNTVAWHRNEGGGMSFTDFTVSDRARQASDVCVADMDNDGDLDILSASFFDDAIVWYENDFDLELSVRANGEDDLLIAPAGDPIDVTLAMDAGPFAGLLTDWWILAFSLDPLAVASFDVSGTPGFLPGFSPTGQFPLATFPPASVLATSSLPAGSYVFVFGIDAPNGLFDSDAFFFDDVGILVTP